MPIPYFPNTNWWSSHYMAIMMVVVAIVVAFYIAYREVKRQNMNLDMFFVSALWVGAGALIGARLAYRLTPGHLSFNLFNGELHSWGGILGGFFGLMIFCAYNKRIRKEHKKNVCLFSLTDIIVPGVAIGTFFFRIGDFLTRCIEIGTETNLPWAILDYGISRHPINIYYSIAGLAVFIALIEIRKNKARKNSAGYITLWFFVLYPLSRVLLDFLREYTIKYFGMGFGQAMYFLMFLGGVYGLIKIKSGGHKK